MADKSSISRIFEFMEIDEFNIILGILGFLELDMINGSV